MGLLGQILGAELAVHQELLPVLADLLDIVRIACQKRGGSSHRLDVHPPEIFLVQTSAQNNGGGPHPL